MCVRDESVQYNLQGIQRLNSPYHQCPPAVGLLILSSYLFLRGSTASPIGVTISDSRILSDFVPSKSALNIPEDSVQNNTRCKASTAKAPGWDNPSLSMEWYRPSSSKVIKWPRSASVQYTLSVNQSTAIPSGEKRPRINQQAEVKQTLTFELWSTDLQLTESEQWAPWDVDHPLGSGRWYQCQCHSDTAAASGSGSQFLALCWTHCLQLDGSWN